MSTELPKPPSARLTSMDAYRGFVMFLMMAEVLRVSRVARAFPDSTIWQWLSFNTSHVEWVGCSLHDMIQPSFSFLVGVALPYSIASRLAKGQTQLALTAHAVWRALLLILLGVFLRSVGSAQTNWTFEDTLTQIGLGYPILFLLGFHSPRVQWAALAVILIGYWVAWAMYPLPGPEFDYAKVGVPPDWTHHANGLAAHWNKNSNLGSALDQWFLNLFPRGKEFVANGGGYLTLSFIPTLGTMVLGLIAGGWLRSEVPAKAKIKKLALVGVICLVLGTTLHVAGVCPLVKRIWTPTWTLFSGGLCFLFMATFYAVIDVRGWKWWSFPLVVIGMNSIAAYCLSHLIDGFIAGSLKTHFGQDFFKRFGETFAPMAQGAAVLLVLWLILYWMYRRKLFLKI
jgi:heparan-alpha-glucosaminide N-acetyltransferase